MLILKASTRGMLATRNVDAPVKNIWADTTARWFYADFTDDSRLGADLSDMVNKDLL